MKAVTKILASVTIALLSQSCGKPETTNTATVENAAVANQPVVHIVAFRFKTDVASRKKIPGIVQAFADLKRTSVDAKQPGRHLIQNFQYGSNNSTEQVSFGKKGEAADRSTEYTFVLTFRDIKDRDYYVNEEPHHQAFKKLVGDLLENGVEGVFVTDFSQK